MVVRQSRKCGASGLSLCNDSKGLGNPRDEAAGGPTPSVDIYDVAISGADDAIEAVRRVCESGPETIVETIAELPEGTDLRDGEVILR
jgi:hypothetical protein